jgi:hypothetical protein
VNATVFTTATDGVSSGSWLDIAVRTRSAGGTPDVPTSEIGSRGLDKENLHNFLWYITATTNTHLILSKTVAASGCPGPLRW